jgi:TonB family protein
LELGPNSEEKRRVTRIRVIDSQLITVDLGDGNSGLMVDAAEWGIAVQAVAAPPVGSQRAISFLLPSSNVKISAAGRITWKDNTNQLGIHFTEISDMQRKVLRKWLEEVDRQTTEAMLEWDSQGSEVGADLAAEPATPKHVYGELVEAKGSTGAREKIEVSEAGASAGVSLTPPKEEPEDDIPKAEEPWDPFAPRRRETREPEQKPEPAWDPFARVKRGVQEDTPEHRSPQRWAPLPPPHTPESHPSRGSSTALTEYEEPRYYPAAPPPTRLPEGAVAIAQAPAITARPLTKPIHAPTTRERFERWVVEKHEGSKVEKIKTATALVLLILGMWLFVKLLPPIATELRYDWNKFAAAFNLPVIGDGRIGPPAPPVENAYPTFPAAVKTESSAATPEPEPESSRAVARRTAPAHSPVKQPTADAPPGVYVPSFGASAPYRLRLPDGVTPGRLLYQVRPVYPERARAKRPDPRVAVRAVVDTNGRVTATLPLQGDSTLTAAAMQAIRQWRYEPYRVAGKPVEVETRIDVDFSAVR